MMVSQKRLNDQLVGMRVSQLYSPREVTTKFVEKLLAEMQELCRQGKIIKLTCTTRSHFAEIFGDESDFTTIYYSKRGEKVYIPLDLTTVTYIDVYDGIPD